jgi:hypothetical protein
MAAASRFKPDEDLYGAVYEYLSGFSHPNFAKSLTYLASDRAGFDHSTRELYFEARALAFLVSEMFLHAVYESGFMSEAFHRDLGNYLSRTRRHALEVVGHMHSKLSDPFRRRLELLPEPRTIS